MRQIFDFSKEEIERLFLIKEVLEKRAEKIDYAESKAQCDISQFLESIDAYNGRFDTYKYLLFAILESDIWEERLLRWTNMICLPSETPYFYYYQLLSLLSWIHGIIPGCKIPTAHRIKHACLRNYGYEKGIEIIRQLLILRKGQNLVQNLWR